LRDAGLPAVGLKKCVEGAKLLIESRLLISAREINVEARAVEYASAGRTRYQEAPPRGVATVRRAGSSPRRPRGVEETIFELASTWAW